jgi:ABC-type amino acid transport substrate-binding protein
MRVNTSMNKAFLKIQSFLLAGSFIFISITAAAQLKGDLLKEAEISKKAELVCLYNQTSGFSYKDEQGKVKGFCVDVLNHFADYVKNKEGISITYKFEEETVKEFDSFLDHVKSSKGGVFGLGSITITEERKKKWNLSPRIMQNLTFIVTHKDVPDLKSLDEIPKAFSAMTGYAVKGTSFEKKLLAVRDKYYPGLAVLNKTPGLDSFEKLLNQKNTLQAIDLVAYLSLIKKGMALKRHSLLDGKEDLCLVLAQSNDWDVLFKEFLSSGFVDSPAYRKIIADNFGTRFLDFMGSMK